jgi:hypothetical protein
MLSRRVWVLEAGQRCINLTLGPDSGRQSAMREPVLVVAHVSQHPLAFATRLRRLNS